MSDDEHDDERGGRFAVPGEESVESDETLSPDERSSDAAIDQPLPGPPAPAEPKQPNPE
ncbi:MAG TPA: hypothetical protein VFA30_09730 [Gaiellaceae bacterium]|nr:hypothetical protein [Gaiellaceae bacterium]